MPGVHGGARCDPPCLTRTDQPDACTVDLRPRPHGGNGTHDVGRREVEVAVVARAAFALGIPRAALVEREDCEASVGERPEKLAVPPYQALGFTRPVYPDQGGMSPAARGLVQRARDLRAFADISHRNLDVAAHLGASAESRLRRRATRALRVRHTGTTASSEHQQRRGCEQSSPDDHELDDRQAPAECERGAGSSYIP